MDVQDKNHNKNSIELRLNLGPEHLTHLPLNVIHIVFRYLKIKLIII